MGFGDLDQDGRVDLLFTDVVGATGASANKDVFWSRSVGAGAFAAPIQLPVQRSAWDSINVVDIDLRDGPDVLLTSKSDRQLLALLNLGAGQLGDSIPLDSNRLSYAAPTNSNLPGSPLLLLGDTDGDGDPDALYYTADTVNRFATLTNESISTVGTAYCSPAVPNSAGLRGALEAIGSDEVQRNELQLRATQLPPFVFGLFFIGPVATTGSSVPASQGLICVGGAIGRFVGPGQIQNSGAGGVLVLQVDLTAIPRPATGFTSVQPGETWFFQAWHRDQSPTGAVTTNFTDALEVTFR